MQNEFLSGVGCPELRRSSRQRLQTSAEKERRGFLQIKVTLWLHLTKEKGRRQHAFRQIGYGTGIGEVAAIVLPHFHPKRNVKTRKLQHHRAAAANTIRLNCTGSAFQPKKSCYTKGGAHQKLVWVLEWDQRLQSRASWQIEPWCRWRAG